ncbi:ribosomal biogenesis protein LAS1L-like, partial [Panicum hallii]|uniref:ribosomal biogenesis protein LAS1L-like n=1 Tax=Panicum hallii TaxID=206008 RepID=UPI000DF4E277
VAEAAPAPEASGFYAGVGRLSTGRKLVPWSNWEEWRFVRDGLFSPFPAAALRRIAAWRSRGSVLIPVDVTAAFVEIRLRDPFFRSGLAGDDAMESEEMLAMLYSMAIMRLVNGFVENQHKKTGRSISELAEAVGIPRILVNIRHESSHRNLPSLPLLRLACIKAFDWLKCIYWDRQTNSIPDVEVELGPRLHEIASFLKENDSKESKSGSKRKRSEKLIVKAIKYTRRLYYACPFEVVSGLLDLMQLDAPESPESSDMKEIHSLGVYHSSDTQMSNSDMKTIIMKLSEKEPRLLLSVLKSVIEMIKAKEELKKKVNLMLFYQLGHLN